MSFDTQVSPDGKTLRALAGVAATYDADDPTKYLIMQNFNQAVLYCNLATMDATSVEIKIQAAAPLYNTAAVDADFFDLPAVDLSGATLTTSTATIPIRSGIYQMLAVGKLAIPVPCNYKYIRVLAKRTAGTTGGTTLSIYATSGKA